MKIINISLYKINGANLMDNHSPAPSFFLDGFYMIKIFTNQGIQNFGSDASRQKLSSFNPPRNLEYFNNL